MFDLVIYHKNCTDGACGAYLASLLAPEAELFPASYGDEAPEVAGKRVVIVDFSYPRDVLVRMEADAASLIVFDHHKTAQKALEGLDFCLFNMEMCGSAMFFSYFIDKILDGSSGNEIANYVFYVQDRDLWKFALPHSKEVNASFGSYPPTPEGFKEIVKKPLREHLISGEALLKYQKTVQDLAISNAQPIILRGIEGLAVNNPVLVSEVAGELAKKTNFGCCFFLTEEKALFSLRSVGDFDVSELAKSFGGGGHKNAAGFIIPRDQLFTTEGVEWPQTQKS